MIILAIDPGPEQSAFVEWDGVELLDMRIEYNQRLIYLLDIRAEKRPFNLLAIEKVMSYGMPVSTSIFDTIWWTGRFCQAYPNFVRVPRMDVKLHLCKDSRARDSNIRQALIDRFGKPGTKKQKGLTYGLKKDLWQAFALAVTVWDKEQEK